MLNQVETMFDNMIKMNKKLKKASYEANMKTFLEQHGHYFTEMTGYIEQNADKEAAAKELAEIFVKKVGEKHTIKGKIKSYTQVDMNFFMIYYVFPAILKTEHAEAKRLADVLCATWGAAFKDSKIGYTDYDTLYKNFRQKIFGIF